MMNHGATLLLGGIGAALVLLVVHLFGLRIRQTVQFAHEHFLRSVVAKSRSSQKLQNIVLLLLRITFISSLVAGFYFLFSQQDQSSVKATDNSVILLDNSWSMASPNGTGAISKLNQVIQDINILGVDGATIQTFSGNIASIGSTSGQNQNAELSPSMIHAAAFPAIASQRRSTSLFVLSDFQRNSDVKSLIKRLPNNATLIVYPSGNQPNLFIDSLWLTEPLRGKNSNIEIDLRVAGSNLAEATQVTVRALQGALQLGVGQVLLEPNKNSVLHFSIAPGTTSKAVTFVVDDSKVKYDNEFFAVLPPFKSSSIYVSPSLGKDHPVVKAFKEESAFSFSGDLSKVSSSLWVLDASLSTNTSIDERQLQNWLNKGGQILISPAPSKNIGLIQALSSLGLKGINELATHGAKLPLKAPDTSNPFFQQIFEKRERNISMPEVSPVLQWRNAYQDILQFQNGLPFLSTFRVGKGQIHLFASPINTSSAFATHPLFVPVLYQLAWGVSKQQALAYVPEGGAIAIPFTSEEISIENAAFQLRKGKQSFMPEFKYVNGQLNLTLPSEVNSPGIYSLYRGDKLLSEIAINLPRSESELEAYSVDEIEDMLPEGTSIKVVDAGDQNIPLEKQLQKDQKGPLLWKYCLILCLLCLMAETLILTSKKRGSLSQSS